MTKESFVCIAVKQSKYPRSILAWSVMFAVLALYMNNLQLKVCLAAITKSKAICSSYDITVTAWLRQLPSCQLMDFTDFEGFLLHPERQ